MTLFGAASVANKPISRMPRMPAPAATAVFRNTTEADCLAVSAEPALKPNQPAHRSPAPTSTSGLL
ncbi:hypothetical protein GCM10027038_06550 [Arthrobacter bambusae]